MSVQNIDGKGAMHDRVESGVPVPDRIEVRDVVAILIRRKGWVVGVTLLLCALAGLYVMTARPAYTAVAQVYVDPRDRPTPKEEPATQNSVPGDGLLLVESQLKIITSNDVLGRVVDRLDLAHDPVFDGEQSLTRKIKDLLGVPHADDPALTALRNLRLRTTAKRNDRSFVIDIAVSGGSAAQAEALTNAVADTYVAEQAEANAAFSRRLSGAITAQLDGMRTAVSQSEQAVASYKAAHDLVGSSNRLVSDEELDQTNTQVTSAMARLSEAQARVRLVEGIASGGAELDALPEAVQSATMMQLRARAADVSRDVAQLAMTNGPSHPALQQARAQLRDIQSAIRAQVRLIAQSVRNTETAEQTNLRSLQGRLETLKARSKAKDKITVPLRELERKADADRTVYESFLTQAKVAGEQQAVDTTNIRLISRALPPDRKSWPPTAIVMAAALFAGLALGIAAALARDSLADRRERVTEPSLRPAEGRAAARTPVAMMPR